MGVDLKKSRIDKKSDDTENYWEGKYYNFKYLIYVL